MLRRALVGAVLGLVLSAGMAGAATIGFTIDKAGSSVKVTSAADGLVCSFTRCGVSAALAAGLGGSFDLGTGQTRTFDFITWTGKGTGGTILNVTAKLAFSAPTGADTEGVGVGGAALLNGSIVGGFLTWTNLPKHITLGDGSKISVDFQGGVALLEGKTVTTSASVTGESIGPAPIPLPPAALLLVGALGSLGFAGRRRRAA